MVVAAIIGSGISLLLLIHTLVNAFLLRRPEPAAACDTSVAILVPCRNEEDQIDGLLHSLQQQQFLRDFHIYVLDDNSTDHTFERAQALADRRTTVHSGAPLEASWLGKPFACHQLAQLASDAEILVFIDADVRLKPTAVAQAIATMKKTGLSLLSPYPEQIAYTWSERLLQPLLHWSWLATLPLRIAEKSVRPSLTVANGQFLVVDAAAYRMAGGHRSIAHEVLDDLELLKAFKAHGFRGCVIDGSEVASCRMYTNWSQVERGYTKWLWAAFGSLPVTLAAVAFLFVTYLLPFLGGGAVAVIAYTSGVLSRLIAAVRTKGRPLDAFFHPFSIALLIALIAYSWWRKIAGTTTWKDRVLAP